MRTATLITTVLAARGVPTVAPSAPAITSPTADQVFGTLTPTITMSASATGTEPITYGYEIATDIGMTSVIDSNANSGLSDAVSPALANHQPILYIRPSATNSVGTTYGAVVRFAVSAFTQSAGANLLTNGTFTGGLTGWTASGAGDPGVTGVGDAAVFVSTATANLPTLTQAGVVVSGSEYEVLMSVTARASGTARLSVGNGINVLTVSTRKSILRSTGTDVQLLASGAAPHSFTIDDVSVALLTLNTAIAKVADGTHVLKFTLPGSPIAGQRIEMRYRRQDATNYFVVFIFRNAANTAWDVQLSSVIAGTATALILVNGVGTPDTIKAVTSGNSHDVYTIENGVETKRGGTINNANLAAQTGIMAVYNSDITPVQLSSV
jgi:hypothetical protein